MGIKDFVHRVHEAGLKTFRDLGKVICALPTCYGEGHILSVASHTEEEVIGEEALRTPIADGDVASSSQALTPRKQRLELLRSECGSEVEYEIKKSSEHWTEVPRQSIDDHALLSTNTERFKHLMEQWRCPTSEYGFFLDYGERLMIGEKIAEGGQAEIFNARFVDDTRHFVLKVFKYAHLEDLERLWPAPLLPLLYVDYEPDWMRYEGHCCWVRGGTVLKDGRFAFLMDKYASDLRSYIDDHVRAKQSSKEGPFRLRTAVYIMLKIAEGMRCLHEHGILHRDLKASNVLVKCDLDLDRISTIAITDFETSLGVYGTGFWRAPEVLRALRAHNLQPDVWTKEADVYSYAMTCYEIITGHLPFEDVRQNDYDVVLNGGRPSVPDWYGPKVCNQRVRCMNDIFCNPKPGPVVYQVKEKQRSSLPWLQEEGGHPLPLLEAKQSLSVPESKEKRLYPVPWLKELLERCWDHDPSERPSFDDIVKTFSLFIYLIPTYDEGYLEA